MKTKTLTLYDFLSDYDNWELSTSERKEQLMDAVVDYNERYGTDHNPLAAYYNYERERKKEDQ